MIHGRIGREADRSRGGGGREAPQMTRGTLGMTHGWNKTRGVRQVLGTRGVRQVLPTVLGKGHERVGEILEIHGRRAHPQLVSEKKGFIGAIGVPLPPTLGLALTLGLRQPPERTGIGVDYTTDSKMLGLLGEALEMAG